MKLVEKIVFGQEESILNLIVNTCLDSTSNKNKKIIYLNSESQIC